MLTFIWLIFSTFIGGIISYVFFVEKFISISIAILVGCLLGFILGVILRFIPDLADVGLNFVD